MNKEVIYLEPDDDITDILTKLQRAEQKLVALVPPKKATMLRSAVNMKLVARAAKECKKVAVIVTADPAIIKLAMAARIPVAKTLQSRPMVPTPETVKDSEHDEQVIDEDLTESAAEKAELDELKDKKDASKTPGDATKSAEERRSDKKAQTFDLSEESLESGSKGSKNGKKDAKKGDKDEKEPKMAIFTKYRKWVILGAIAAVLLVVVGVWAFVFAPAVDITVAMSTSATNFSEEVRFTTDKAAADPATGVFYADRRTYEAEYTDKFEATGKEDRGERATGAVSLTMTFVPTIGTATTIGLKRGTTLTATTADGKSVSYTLDEDYTTEYDGTDNGITAIESAGWSCPRVITSGSSTCRKTVSSAKVTATAAGENYNIGAGRTWNSITDDDEAITVNNSGAFTGGTTHDVTTVTQSNIDSAKESIIASHAIDGKDALFESIKSDDIILLESSFGSEAGDVKSTPAVNGEVDENAKPELTVKAIYYVYTISKSDVEEFIKTKTQLADDQRIYSIGEPYVERFTSIDEAARLKTVIKTGPTVTEEDILEKSKGRKIGEVQSLLRSINGVSSVTITPSYFWVWSVPNDPSKITIQLTVEDN